MKRVMIVIWAAFCLTAMRAEHPQQKFSPEKYQAEMEQFITNEARLTPQEAAAFFPLFREMQQKQRGLFMQTRAEGKIKPATDEECFKAIQRRDQAELELKNIQQTYHNKFLGVLSASKVYDVIRAEDHFHRRMFKNWGKGGGKHQ